MNEMIIEQRILIMFNAKRDLQKSEQLVRKFHCDHLWIINKKKDELLPAIKFLKTFSQVIRTHYRTVELHHIDTDFYDIVNMLQSIASIFAYHNRSGQFFLDLSGGTTMAVAALYASQLFPIHIVNQAGEIQSSLTALEVPQFSHPDNLDPFTIRTLIEIYQYQSQNREPLSKTELIKILNGIKPKLIEKDDFRKLNSILLPFISNDLLMVNQDSTVEITKEGKFMMRIFGVYHGLIGYESSSKELQEFIPKRRILITAYTEQNYGAFKERLWKVYERIKPDKLMIFYNTAEIAPTNLEVFYKQVDFSCDLEMFPRPPGSFEDLLLFLTDLLKSIQQHEVYLNIMGGEDITLALAYVSLLFKVHPVFAADYQGEFVYIDDFMKLNDFTLHEMISRRQIEVLTAISEFAKELKLRKIGKRELIELFQRRDLLAKGLSGSGTYASLRALLGPLIERRFLAEKKGKIYVTNKGALFSRIYLKSM